MQILIYPPVDPQRLQRIQSAACGAQVVNAHDLDEALQAMPAADAFFGKITPALLAVARCLKWVQSPTASLEHYLFPELIEHPCRLSNMRGLFSDVVADHAMGMILTFARNLHVYRDRQQRGEWSPVGGESTRPSFAVGPGVESEIDRRHLHLADCTLGVVGVGAIGAEIVRRGTAFGMSVRGVDPMVASVPGYLEQVWPLHRLNDLLAESDFVVLAAPHTPDTAGMIRRPQLQIMRQQAYLINVGRGVLVNLADLTVSLQTGLIAGAAVDVLESEPLPADHPLWKMENVLITPHIAAASQRVPQRHLELLVENIRRFVQGETPLNLVDKRQWF